MRPADDSSSLNLTAYGAVGTIRSSATPKDSCFGVVGRVEA